MSSSKSSVDACNMTLPVGRCAHFASWRLAGRMHLPHYPQMYHPQCEVNRSATQLGIGIRSASGLTMNSALIRVGPGSFDRPKFLQDLESRLSLASRGEVLVVGTNATNEVVRAVLALEESLSDPSSAAPGVGNPRERLAIVPVLDVEPVEGRFVIGILVRPTSRLPAGKDVKLGPCGWWCCAKGARKRFCCAA